MRCPAEQAERVHLLELADKERPRGFNPIELDDADPELVAAQFVDTMRDLYFATLGSAHRQIQYLRSALMTLLTMPPRAEGPWTLASLYSLFVDPRFREELHARADRSDPVRLLGAPVADERAAAATRRPTRSSPNSARS